MTNLYKKEERALLCYIRDVAGEALAQYEKPFITPAFHSCNYTTIKTLQKLEGLVAEALQQG